MFQKSLNYNWTPEMIDIAIQHLDDYFCAHGSSGESLQQNDNANLEAINVLSDIADQIFK